MKNNLFSTISLSEITDEFILNNFFNKIGRINGQIIQNLNKGYYPSIIEYLNNKFPDSDSFSETIYRIKYHIEEKPTCLNCGKKLKFKGTRDGFGMYCSAKCQNSDPNKIVKDKQTKFERYGNSNYNNMEKNRQTCKEHFGVESYFKTQKHKDYLNNSENGMGSEYFKEKSKQTKLEKYGDENYNNREKCIETTIKKYGVKNTKQAESAKQKEKETCMQKYGVSSYRKTKECEEKIRKTTLEKWGVEHITQSKKWSDIWYNNEEWIKHKNENRYKTLKNNKSYNQSKPELLIYNELKKYYNDIKYQYSEDNRYPFCCDFYIPSKDLFIEYNGYWTHGNMIYDSNNPKCIEQLNKWKQRNKIQEEKGNYANLYKNAINTWTVRDVKKYQTAKNNKLNYLILWYKDYKNIDEIKNKIDQF